MSVRGYTDKQILDRIKIVEGFKTIPNEYFLVGIQSNENNFNVFDDKVYLFKGTKFIAVAPATTNAGSVLDKISPFVKAGTAVIKTNKWYYDLWTPGRHKQKMRALVQVSPISYYRDNDKNKKPDEKGKLYNGIIGINFHTVSYTKLTKYIAKYINTWSIGCIVVPDVDKYYGILNTIGKQRRVSFCLLREF